MIGKEASIRTTRAGFTALFAAALLTLGGCGDGDGAAEQAGEQVDKAAEQAKDAAEKAGDKVENATD